MRSNNRSTRERVRRPRLEPFLQRVALPAGDREVACADGTAQEPEEAVLFTFVEQLVVGRLIQRQIWPLPPRRGSIGRNRRGGAGHRGRRTGLRNGGLDGGRWPLLARRRRQRRTAPNSKGRSLRALDGPGCRISPRTPKAITRRTRTRTRRPHRASTQGVGESTRASAMKVRIKTSRAYPLDRGDERLRAWMPRRGTGGTARRNCFDQADRSPRHSACPTRSSRQPWWS